METSESARSKRIPNILRRAYNRKKNETKPNVCIKKCAPNIVLDSYICGNTNKVVPKKADSKGSRKIVLDSYLCNSDKNTVSVSSDSSKNLNESLNVGANLQTSPLIHDILPKVSNTNESRCKQNNGSFLNLKQFLLDLKNNKIDLGKISFGIGAEEEVKWYCPVPDCYKIYDHKSELYSHIFTHSEDQIYRCTFDGCLREFTNEHLLQQHIENSHKPPTLPYDINEPTITIEKALASIGFSKEKLESCRNTDNNLFMCPQENCIFQCKNLSSLKIHMCRHYNINPFKCSYEHCYFSTCFKFKLKKHLNIHKESNNNMHTFNYVGYNKRTVNINEFGAEKCSLCKKDSVNPCNNIENLQETSLVRCESCKINNKKFVCKWSGCGRTFSKFSKLRYHIRSHNGDRPFHCKYENCNAAFESSSQLKRHSNSHRKTGERKYECTQCFKKFLRSDHLQEHIIRHTKRNEIQYTNAGCDQVLTNNDSIFIDKEVGEMNKVDENREIEIIPSLMDSIQTESIDDLLSFRCARTDVPWSPSLNCDFTTNFIIQNSKIFPQHNSCEKNQGNPLVCGGVSLDDNSSINAGLIPEVENTIESDLPELESDLLESSADHINSLLLQEELSDGMLYTTEDENAFHVLLMNDDQVP